MACIVLAHGAGAGMSHPFLASVAAGLQRRRISVLRYQFPFMEAGSRRPDTPVVAQATVRAAVRTVARLAGSVPVFAGGKSFGGRMTSQAQAAEPLPGVHGLVFLGFPLHPAGKPSTVRAEHLGLVTIPMLFLQGTRDALAAMDLIETVLVPLPRAKLAVVAGADHSFAVLVRSGRTPGDVLEELCDAISAWINAAALDQ